MVHHGDFNVSKKDVKYIRHYLQTSGYDLETLKAIKKFMYQVRISVSMNDTSIC